MVAECVGAYGVACSFRHDAERRAHIGALLDGCVGVVVVGAVEIFLCGGVIFFEFVRLSK